jgi:hypothetical protein
MSNNALAFFCFFFFFFFLRLLHPRGISETTGFAKASLLEML